MLNKPSPLPLNEDAVIVVLTTNPKFGEIDAVALPLAIRDESPVKDENGISNNPLPLPLNIDAERGNWNVEKVFTTNPVSGAIEAVAEPENIFERSKSDSADNGISNNLAPLPE
jgi:hypothetical protein